MPIYAYRCTTCGHAQDVLQKMSDPVLSTCPACGAATYAKQLTAAGFQLKGSGWYVTDFRGGKTEAKTAGDTAKADKAGEKAAEKPAEKSASEAKPAEKAATTPAAAPAAPAPTPSSGA